MTKTKQNLKLLFLSPVSGWMRGTSCKVQLKDEAKTLCESILSLLVSSASGWAGLDINSSTNETQHGLIVKSEKHCLL